MHQNTDANFPNQETGTSQSSNPTHWEKPPQLKGTMDHQNTERPLQTQQSNKIKRQRNTQQVEEHKNVHQTKQKRRRQGIYLKKNLE